MTRSLRSTGCLALCFGRRTRRSNAVNPQRGGLDLSHLATQQSVIVHSDRGPSPYRHDGGPARREQSQPPSRTDQRQGTRYPSSSASSSTLSSRGRQAQQTLPSSSSEPRGRTPSEGDQDKHYAAGRLGTLAQLQRKYHKLGGYRRWQARREEFGARGLEYPTQNFPNSYLQTFNRHIGAQGLMHFFWNYKPVFLAFPVEDQPVIEYVIQNLIGDLSGFRDLVFAPRGYIINLTALAGHLLQPCQHGPNIAARLGFSGVTTLQDAQRTATMIGSSPEMIAAIDSDEVKKGLFLGIPEKSARCYAAAAASNTLQEIQKQSNRCNDLYRQYVDNIDASDVSPIPVAYHTDDFVEIEGTDLDHVKQNTTWTVYLNKATRKSHRRRRRNDPNVRLVDTRMQLVVDNLRARWRPPSK